MSKKKSVVVILSVVALVFSVVIIFVTVLNVTGNKKNDELTAELTDEFSRIRWFVVDWFNELSPRGTCVVYLNELQFSGGQFTLTVAQNRIRAVYPRGERFFKIELVKKIEFFEVNGILRCRLSYGESGEYLFKIN